MRTIHIKISHKPYIFLLSLIVVSIATAGMLVSCATQQQAPSTTTATTLAPPLEITTEHHSFLDPEYNESKRNDYDAYGRRFAISSQGRYASLAAKNIYRKSGNLIDAAIAASFVLAVERPQDTGLGGGGFMLIRIGKTRRTVTVDDQRHDRI